MNDNELRDIARKLPKTCDTKYNEGKKHFANGMDTKEAQYFLMCEGGLRKGDRE